MTTIYCTQKLRKELGVKDAELVPREEAPAGIGNWFANLLRFGPKKAVLFINEKTCYAVVALDVRKPEIRELGKLLLDRLPRVMQAGGFTEQTIEKVVSEHSEFVISKSSDKKILGYMTDFGKNLRYAVDAVGGLANKNEIAAANSLNAMPLLSFDGAPAEYLLSILLTGGIRNANNEFHQKIVNKYRKVFGYGEVAPSNVVQFPVHSRKR